MIKVTFLLRSPAPGRHFSIERVVDDVATHLPGDLVGRQLRVPGRGAGVRSMLQNCRFVRSVDSDVVHVTGDIHYVLPFVRRSARRVLTVHDLASLRRTSGLRRRVIRWWWYTLPFWSADLITVVSDETAADIRRLFPRLAKPLVTIENPVSACFEPSAEQRPVGRRVLAVGTGENKNLPRLAEALAGLDVELRVVGVLTPLLDRLFVEHKLRVTSVASISDKELAEEYRAADVLAFVSLSEGFGLPIVEAQACGIPVVTSNMPPMNDVAGSGAALVDPTDTDSIRNAILAMLDGDIRHEMIIAGLANVVDRRPAVVAARYAQVFLDAETESLP